MVALSKIYEDPLCRLDCSAIVHPGQNCFNFALGNFKGLALSNAKYFLPLLVSPLITKRNDTNPELVMKALKLYASAIGCTMALGILVPNQVCLQRHLLGRFYKYTLGSLPGFIGSLVCWFFPRRVLHLFILGSSQATIEIMIRHRSNSLTRLICDSKLVRTLLFMVNSAFILHCKRANLYKGFWFIKPIQDETAAPNISKKEQDNVQDSEMVNSGKCTHSGQTCWSFCWSGLKSYLLLGIPVDLISIFRRSKIPNGTHGFLNILLAKIRQLDVRKFKMTSFFLFYVGIYRLSHCLLNQQICTSNSQRQWQHLASAFFGGAAYMFLDQLTIYTFSLVIGVQVLWQLFCQQSHDTQKENSLFSILKRIEFAKILIPLYTAYLGDIFFYKNHLLNSLSKGFIHSVTNNKFNNIYKNLMDNDMEMLLRNAAMHI